MIEGLIGMALGALALPGARHKCHGNTTCD